MLALELLDVLEQLSIHLQFLFCYFLRRVQVRIHVVVFIIDHGFFQRGDNLSLHSYQLCFRFDAL